MEPPERLEVSPQFPADEDKSQSVGHSSINQMGPLSHRSAFQDQDQLRQLEGLHVDLDFQDSNLSPGLALLPLNSGVEHNFPEYSLFQQSDNEFAPLRAYPDISMASDRFHFPAQDRTTQASERGSLSQHPLAQATILSEEGANSGSLSRHSLSPGDQGRQEKMVRSRVTAASDANSREKDSETQTNPREKLVGESVEDETFFLSKHIPAQHLLELLEKDAGMPSTSNSAVSSETSIKSVASFADQSSGTKVSKPGTNQSMVRREGPPGEASLPQQQMQQPVTVSNPDQSRALSSEVFNITTGSRSTQPDYTSEVLHRELLCEVEKRSSPESESENRQQKSASLPGQCLTPYPMETSEAKPSVTHTKLGGMPQTEPFSAAVTRVQREQDLWSSGNQTGIDGSYLGFLPQSQSTPGVFKPPSKSSVKATLGQLSAIESIKEKSHQSSTGISPGPVFPESDVHGPNTEKQCQEEHTSSKVQSLPSLNYMQKVDAWRANQGSGKTSLFDSLALQGFSGISPKKKAYDAVSDTLNRILSQQARSLQQPPVLSATNQNVTHSSSVAPSGSSSPRRGEAVGSAPSDKENNGSAARPSASPCARSHSSLSTVVTSVQKDLKTRRPTKTEKSQTEDDVRHQPSATAQPSPLVSLGQFSDVSVDRDLTLSSSQASYNSGIKLGASIGASSVTSLEVDNYVPYWTSKPSTPPPLPRPPELNIEERIPLYLHNLGIDQSPSKILTPFAPRGPIREPEFSPTDLCTIKGSTGTPTKSTQPSEGGTPHKGEFSRSSILSVDSSISIPLSLDSLGPAASVPERIRRTSPSSDADAVQSEPRSTPSSQPDEDLPSILQQQTDGSFTGGQNAIQPGGRFDSDLPLATKTRYGDRDLESPLQTSHSLEQSAEDSFVSSKALQEIRKLLSQVENSVSAGPSAASSASSAAPRLLSDGDIFLSLRKKSSRLQDRSFSPSSATGDPRTHSSLLWARSSSDSMLTSEKPRQSSVGPESMSSSWQPDYPSTQSLITAPAAGTYRRPQESTVSAGAGSPLVLSKSAQRAEPEGCSAAPPDNKVPTQPPVVKPLPAVTPQQLASTPADAAAVPEEGEKTAAGGPVRSSSPSPSFEDTDQGAMSDGSSDSSLAVRVAKLLQSESPATMVSSTPSVTDQEESRAREWLKMKISGQQCEPLELDKEDRQRIEEIKRELLLKYPMKSQMSTDTESSAASSVAVRRGPDPPRPAETFAAPGDASKQPPRPLQGLSTNPADTSVELRGLEAQVWEIAAREGVTLPRTNPQALTSITIATRRRSTSPSPSTSPAPPINLTELSTGAVGHPKAGEPASAFEPRSPSCTRRQSGTSQMREEAVGGQYEEAPPPSLSPKEDVTIKDDNTQSFQRDEELSIQDSSELTRGSPAPGSPARTGHVSHVHLTLSPKSTDHSSAAAVHSSHADAVGGPPPREFVPLRHSSSVASSPDEGVGLCSPPEWCETRETNPQPGNERADASTLFRTAASTGKLKQRFTPRHRPEVSQRALTSESPAVPVLLPYKPSGSEELFYVPQLEADVSDTTMESSHTGSDDAVPPRFSSEVLGHQDPGLDRGVTIRHAEGIYSKRFKTATFKMQDPGHRDASLTAEKSSQTSVTQTPRPSPQASAAFTRAPASNKQEASRRDRGTSPLQFVPHGRLEPSRERFQPVDVGMDFDKAGQARDQSHVPQREAERDRQRAEPDVPRPASQQNDVSLDELWQRFCAEWTVADSRRTGDREASLLERLERLSRLIHSRRATNMVEVQEEGRRGPQATKQKLGRRGEDAVREEQRHSGRTLHNEAGEIRGSRAIGDKPPVPLQARRQRLQVQPTAPPASSTSSLPDSSSQSERLRPADRDESETLSTTSGSLSTVDTARLLRVFGAHRVQRLKSGSGLGKLYSTINKQKEGREQRRGRNDDSQYVITPSDTTGADESTVVTDSASSTSTYTLPSHRGPSKTPAAKKSVKLLSKGIQTAGDLEIVRNGTRRHTRDVGTTFPSPCETTAWRQASSPSPAEERGGGGGGGGGGQRSPSQLQPSQKQRKSRRTPPKPLPHGVSWFISADDLRLEAKKENRREESSPARRPSTAWFEPYSRTHLWREPLRQRQVHEDRVNQPILIHHAQSDLDPRSKTASSGLARVSLQEALEMRRPEFICRSMQRVRRLALQAEERQLQAAFTRQREELFNRPGGLGRLAKPAGTALLRRAVPRKEMIQRSKQIYESLPEVRRKREEERRKAEYRSYRLNAQLYNKRITNRILGRRTAWQ